MTLPTRGFIAVVPAVVDIDMFAPNFKAAAERLGRAARFVLDEG